MNCMRSSQDSQSINQDEQCIGSIVYHIDFDPIMNWSCLVMKRAFTKSRSPPTALTSTEPAMSNNVPRFLHNIPIGHCQLRRE